MIKLLIVDDEAIERIALQKIVEKGIEGIQVIGQADNGSRAIEMAVEYEPDLILMDIQMPGIGGLEAIKKIKELKPMIKFIMVTAYDSFDYVRQALRLEVKDYLLKPSKAQLIVETVQKVVSEIHMEKQVQEHRKEEKLKLERLMPVVEADLVTQLLFDHVHEIHLDEMLKFLSVGETSRFFVAVVSILPESVSEKNSIESLNELNHVKADELYRAVKEQFHMSAKGWIGPMSGKQIPIIVFNDAQRSYRSQAAYLVRKLVQLSYALHSTRMFIGIGGQYSSLKEVRSSYHEALLASINLDLAAKHNIYEATLRHTDAHLLSADVEKRIVEEARRGNWSFIGHELLQIGHRYEAAGKSVVEAQQKIYELLFVVSRLLLDMGVQSDPSAVFSQMSTFQHLRTQAADCINEMSKAYFEVKNQLEPDVMLQIKQYIREHSNEDISLEMISETVRLSPFYVSKMFKEQFGTNYIDFLTDCRMEKAKDLLADPDKSLKEITYDIGYNNPNYFSRVFKRTTGVSPTDYRKDLISHRRP
jgi:two-component system response regulator YesN